MRSILMTRPEPAGAELSTRLRREGFTVFEAPLSAYVAQTADLSALPNCQALVFTSSHAVEQFAAQSDLRDMPVFTVGDTTAQKAREAGFKFVLSGSGQATELADALRQRRDELGLQRVFHAAGEKTAHDLAALLAGSGIAVTRGVVYSMTFAESMPPEIEQALRRGEISTVLFFSAMAAQHFMRLLQRPDLKKVSEKLEAICMSDRVAAELRGYPWRVLRVATVPNVEAMLDIARSDSPDANTAPSALPALPVIEAFGGLRPLANRLDLTASTVQGWKKRGMIPEARADAVIEAAREDGIDIAAFMTEGQQGMTTENGDKTKKQNTPQRPQGRREDRRGGPDRRQQKPRLDDQGNVQSQTYTGPDRRSGGDRRAYEDAKRKSIREEKWKFMNRTVLMTAFFLIAIIYGAGFLLAPEFFQLKKNASQIEEYERRLQEYEHQLDVFRQKQQQQNKGGSIGNMINNGIAKVGGAVDTAKNTVSAVAGVAGQSIETGNYQAGLQQLFGMMALLQKLNSTEEGRTAVAQMMQRLQAVMSGSTGDDKEALGQAVAQARKKDATLNKLTGDMSTKELGAAALLLTLNELRANMNSERAFEQDLAIVQKFAGNDPAMQQALKNLAPYARSGVLSKQTLQKEFRGIAADIVMAKLQGEDASVRDRVLQRLGQYAKVRKVDDIEGQGVDAVVARAEKMLDEGNIRGAIQELQTLDGESAKTAQPWMNQAAGNVVADDATAAMMQQLMQQMSGMSGGSVEGVFNDIIRQMKGGSSLVPYISPGTTPKNDGNIYPLAPR